MFLLICRDLLEAFSSPLKFIWKYKHFTTCIVCLLVRAYKLGNMVTDNSHCINADLVSLDQEYQLIIINICRRELRLSENFLTTISFLLD